jgi:hypothetical protein
MNKNNNYRQGCAWLRHQLYALLQNVSAGLQGTNMDNLAEFSQVATAKSVKVHAKTKALSRGSQVLCDQNHFQQRYLAQAVDTLDLMDQAWLFALYQGQEDATLAILDHWIAQQADLTARNRSKYQTLIAFALVNFSLLQKTQDQVVYSPNQMAAGLMISERAFYKTWHARYQDLMAAFVSHDEAVLLRLWQGFEALEQQAKAKQTVST